MKISAPTYPSLNPLAIVKSIRRYFDYGILVFFFNNPITLEMANTVTLIFTIKKIVLIVFGIWKKHWTGS